MGDDDEKEQIMEAPRTVSHGWTPIQRLMRRRSRKSKRRLKASVRRLCPNTTRQVVVVAVAAAWKKMKTKPTTNFDCAFCSPPFVLPKHDDAFCIVCHCSG